MAFLDPGTPPDRSGADFSSGWVVSDLKLVVSDLKLVDSTPKCNARRGVDNLAFARVS